MPASKYNDLTEDQIAAELRRLAELQWLPPLANTHGPSAMYYDLNRSPDHPGRSWLCAYAGNVPWGRVLARYGLKQASGHLARIMRREKPRKITWADVPELAHIHPDTLTPPGLPAIQRQRPIRQWCIHTKTWQTIGHQTVYELR